MDKITVADFNHLVGKYFHHTVRDNISAINIVDIEEIKSDKIRRYNILFSCPYLTAQSVLRVFEYQHVFKITDVKWIENTLIIEFEEQIMRIKSEYCNKYDNIESVLYMFKKTNMSKREFDKFNTKIIDSKCKYTAIDTTYKYLKMFERNIKIYAPKASCEFECLEKSKLYIKNDFIINNI